MVKITRLAIIAAIVLLMSLGANASVLTAPGYSVTDVAINMPAFAFLGGFDILPNGNYVVNDGHSIREVKTDGTDGQVFYSYAAPVYGSFVRVNNNTLYFGDSSTGSSKIMSSSLSGGSASVLATLTNNFDMDFFNGDAFVTAGDSVYMLDSNGGLDAIATVDGYSGPLAFDAQGSLYYAPSNYPNPATVLKWSSAEVASAVGAGVLGIPDADVVTSVGGAYGFAFDGQGQLLITNNSSSPVLQVFDGTDVSTIATFNVPNTNYPSLTFIRERANGGLVVGCSYMDSDWNGYTIISEMQLVPEPTSIMALTSLIGLAASRRLLRHSGK
ncbi:MAG: hypothetical protein ACYC64_12645 [Armatimonadota bacterium]